MSLYKCNVCGHLQEFKFPGKSHPPRVIGIIENKLCPSCTRSFGHTDMSSVVTAWVRAGVGDTANTCTCTICRQKKYPWLVVMKDGTRREHACGPLYSECGLFFKDKEGSELILSSPAVLYVVNTSPSALMTLNPKNLLDVVVTLTNGEKISVHSGGSPFSVRHYWWFNDALSGYEYQVPATSVVCIKVNGR